MNSELCITYNRLISFLCWVAVCISFFSKSASATWKVEEFSQNDQIVGLCGQGIPGLGGPADRAINFTNANAVVTLCFHSKYSFDSSTSTPSRYRYLYIVNYALDKQTKPSILHAEGEMMAWAMTYSTTTDHLVFNQYWGLRKVKTYTFDCEKECRLNVSCKVEHLSSDVSNISSQVEHYLKSRQERAQFLMSEDPATGKLLDQLFVTAATGDAKAMKTLNDVAVGMDAAPAEIISSFIEYANDLKKDKCSWE